MNENDIVDIMKDTADRWHTMFYSVYVKQHYGDDITVFYEAVAKAIMDKIREEEKPKAILPDSFDAYMELPYAEKIKLFKKGQQ